MRSEFPGVVLLVVVVIVGGSITFQCGRESGHNDAGRTMYRETCARRCAPRPGVANVEAGWYYRKQWACACADAEEVRKE